MAGFRDEIAALRTQGVAVAAIRARLAERHGEPLSYSAVWRLVQKLEPRIGETFVRVDRQGFDVLCTDAHPLLLHLHAGRADGSVERRLAAYTKPALLVIDDFGLGPLPPSGPADLYDIISERYERGSIILTSNRAVEEWPNSAVIRCSLAPAWTGLRMARQS